MPIIPTVALSEVQTGQLGPRVSPDAFQATNRAITQAGDAIQNTGQLLGRFALQKQEHVNKGILAGEETIRMETAAQIEAYARNNPDKPETWGKFREQAWKQYEQGKAKRAKEQGWAPAVINQDKLFTDAYVAEQGIRFGAETDKAFIRQSNGRILANAQERFKGGDVEGALTAVGNMTLFEDQRQEVVRKMADEGFREIYARKIEDAKQLPPAQGVQEFAALRKELASGKGGVVRDSEGKEIAGLDSTTRNRLVAALGQQESEANNQIRRTTQRLFSVFDATGSAEEFNVQAQAAKDAGLIDGDLFIAKDEETGGYTFKGSAVGDFKSVALEAADQEAGVSLRIAQAKDMKAQDAAFKKQREAIAKQLETAQKLVPEAQAGKLSVEQINERVKKGDIDEAQGDQLRRVVERIAARDLDVGAKLVLAANAKDMDGNPLKDVRGAMVDYRIAAEVARADVAEVAAAGAKKMDAVTSIERQSWLASVNKLPISLEAKAQLMRDYLAAYEVDLIGFEQKAGINAGIWRAGEKSLVKGGTVTHLDGRQLTKPEIEARTMIAKAWKSAPGVGEPWSGDLLLQQEREITAYFTSDEYKDDEASRKRAGEMAARMAREVADVSARRLIDASIPLGVLPQ